MKRVAIYFFFDKDGIVDRYVKTVLTDLKRNIDRLIVVVNGNLTGGGQEIFQDYTNEILVRENKGFDVWAYKTAMDYLGWKNLLEYDELILMNYTIMGPVYPLKCVFDVMDKKNVDFWGITKCFREDSKAAQEMWNNPYGYIPEHIQSSFTVFRNSIMKSSIFQEYWNNMKPILSYYESGGRHEQVITKYFSDNGFKWDCYTQYDDIDYTYYGCCPLITFPLEVVKGKKSPFFKRRSFFTNKRESTAALAKTKELLDFLEKETTYDCSQIYENLIRTCNQRDLVEAFLLVHNTNEIKVDNKSSDDKIAIFINKSNIVEVEELEQHLKSFDKIADVFWADDKSIPSINNLCTGVDADFRCYKYIMVVDPFMKEKDELGTTYNIRQKYYIYNFLDNPERLLQAIDILKNSRFEGMLTGSIDYVKSYYWNHYEQWNDLYYSVERWKEKNSINVQTSVDKSPVRGENGVFLLKTQAIDGLENTNIRNYTMEFLSYAIPLFIQTRGMLPAYFVDSQRVANNIFGYEDFAMWIPELKQTKEKYYKWRNDYFTKIQKENERYIKECESNIDLQHKYIQECENNIKYQQEYIAQLEMKISRRVINKIKKLLHVK